MWIFLLSNSSCHHALNRIFLFFFFSPFGIMKTLIWCESCFWQASSECFVTDSYRASSMFNKSCPKPPRKPLLCMHHVRIKIPTTKWFPIVQIVNKSNSRLWFEQSQIGTKVNSWGIGVYWKDYIDHRWEPQTWKGLQVRSEASNNIQE